MMAPKTKEISADERNIILKLRKEGKTYREIGQIVGRSHSSVQYVVESFNSTGSILSKSRSGRPRKLTEREERTILQAVKRNPRITASKISENIKNSFDKDVHEDTVRKIIKRNGYRSHVARRKPYISEVNRKKRMEFANEYINKPQEFWESVLFSDESKFCIFGIKGRKLVWRKSGTAFDKENLVPTVKHGGGGIMVWGCMAAKGVGNLVFIESTMNQYGYLNILKTNLKQSAQLLELGDDFWFQQDNDPKHAAQNVKLWLLYNTKHQLRTPPQSPDLNPIEHLWDLLERRIRQHHISSKEMLKTVILNEWRKITTEDTSKLVRSMPNRLAEVLKRRGNPTSY